MSETGDGEDQPRHGEPPTYQPPPVWQPPVPPPIYQPPTFQPPTFQPPDEQPPSYPTYPPSGYQQPGYPPPPTNYGQPGYPRGGYGYGLPPAPVPGARLAGMGARFVGLLVDTIVLAVPFIFIGAYAGAFRTTTTCDAFTGTCTRTFDYASGLTLDLVGLLVGVTYWAVLVGLGGQTLGHRAAGIRVVDATTGRVIGPGRAALRWIVMTVTGAFCTLGYWSPLFDSVRRQGWHDKAANSVVIPAH